MIDINGTAYEVFLLDDGTAAVPEVPVADRYEAVFPSACNFLQQTKETANFKLPLAQFHAGPGTFGRNAMPCTARRRASTKRKASEHPGCTTCAAC